MEVALPPRGSLPKPDADDPLDYYYRPLTARIYRARLRLAMRLLGEGPYESRLELGYGSGILLPELARRARRVAAIDVHDQRDAVERALRALGVEAELRQASLFELPYEADTFDAVVCLSVFEHLTELDAAFGELARVLRPGGIAVVGFPTRNPVTDGFFRAVGYNPREIHPASHTDIVEAARRNDATALERCDQLPRFVPRALSAYVACRLRAL
jgi:ubiquinone/menaquinone biosynthesis C-methylase UbiE